LIWRFKNSALIISSELHEKISRSCRRVDQVPSEILDVRQTLAPIVRKDKKRGYVASKALVVNPKCKVAAVGGG